jgi:hypothetical protein
VPYFHHELVKLAVHAALDGPQAAPAMVDLLTRCVCARFGLVVGARCVHARAVFGMITKGDEGVFGV